MSQEQAPEVAPAEEKKESEPKYKYLFSPLKLGALDAPNRMVLAPLTRGRATEAHVPTDIMGTYFEQRADAGLLITDATGISAQGLGWYRAPGIWTDEMTNAWKPVVQAVHKKNGRFCLQLWHMGRQAHSDVTGEPIVSASAIALEGQVTTNKGVKKDYEVPHALTEAEIAGVVKDYGKAAKNAMTAGFDLVEVHAANGYLIDQFLQKVTNQRDDKYGGDIKNRMRLMQEVVAEVVSVVGDSRKVGIRLAPNGSFGGMGSEDNLELFDAAIEWLAGQKLAYVHIMDGLGFGFHKKTKEPYELKRARKILDAIDKDVRIIGNVGYTKELANDRIGAGHADFIAFGRPFISNPDLVTRFKNDLELAEVAPYPTWWGWNLTDKGYIDWPTAGAQEAKASADAAKASTSDK